MARLDFAEEYARQAFRELVGREATPEEIAVVAPIFAGGDENIHNVAGGRAYVAQYALLEKNNPSNVYKKQQEEWATAAPQHYGQVNELVKQIFGRDANQNELDHYGKMLASGQGDAFQLGQFLQSLPEYQNVQDKSFRQGLAGELEGYDKSFFSRAKEDVISRFAQMGRPTSPALDVALTDLQAQINERRGQFLSQLGVQHYGGNKQAAMQSYGQTMEDWRNRENADWAGRQQGFGNWVNRGNEIQDYYTQANDYANWMGRQRGGQSGMGRGVGSLAGMGIGALLAAPTGGMSIPMGAMLGGGFGGGAGGLFDYMNY